MYPPSKTYSIVIFCSAGFFLLLSVYLVVLGDGIVLIEKPCPNEAVDAHGTRSSRSDSLTARFRPSYHTCQDGVGKRYCYCRRVRGRTSIRVALHPMRVIELGRVGLQPALVPVVGATEEEEEQGVWGSGGRESTKSSLGFGK